MKNFKTHFIIDGDKNNALVIFVGKDSSLFGNEDRYLKIAETANTVYGLTVFCFCNPACNWDLKDNGFSFIIDTVKENINENGNIYFFGFSAGATFAIFNAWKYAQIKRMLLVNPPLMVNMHKIFKGIKNFKGISTLIIGEQDFCIKIGSMFERDKEMSGFTDVFIFPKADHMFTGLTDEFVKLPFTYLINTPNRPNV